MEISLQNVDRDLRIEIEGCGSLGLYDSGDLIGKGETAVSGERESSLLIGRCFEGIAFRAAEILLLR